MPRFLNVTALLLLALSVTACKSPAVEYDRSYSIDSGQTMRFQINGETIKTSIHNTGAADLSVHGESADGLMTWQREHIQASAPEPYMFSTTGEVTFEVTNKSSTSGSFQIDSAGKGEVDFREVQ